MLRREIVDLISAALDDLPAAQRAVVLLRDVDGLESAEVCNILRISETNQRVLHHRARSKLRRTLEEYVGAPRRC
jgi:RNA polymerase sigma-70 factor (ECF subfamily)